MQEMQWWQGEWHERQKINEAASELNALAGGQDGLRRQIQRLFALDKDQGKELERLRVTVAVLMDVIVEAGVTTDARLTERLVAALATLEPKPQAGSEAAKPAPRVTRCASCGEEVAANFTYVTERGEVCDRCFSEA